MKWISVKESLPEFNIDVLVFHPYYNMFVTSLYQTVYQDGRENPPVWTDVRGGYDLEIDECYWMPLPQAPNDLIGLKSNMVMPKIRQNIK